MSSKPNKSSEQEPAELTGIIVGKSAENLKDVPTNQAQNETNKGDRQQRIATSAYYRAAQRGFEGRYEIQDWLEAEAEIDSAS